MNRVIYACLLALAVLMARPASAQLASSAWPKFHRDYANGGQSAYPGARPDLSWTYAAPGAVSSAPVIGADGSVYFACDDGNLYALTGGGSLLWSVPCNCLGSSSPAVGADGTIYVGSSNPYVYAFRSDGTLKWRGDLTARVTSSINISSSGVLYFGCSNGTVYAYGTDGTKRWTYSVGGVVTSTPAIGSDGTIYVGSQSGGVYALTSAGGLKWKFAPSEGGGFSASPAVASDGTIYIGSSIGYFYGIRSTGTQRWRTTAGGVVASSAALTSDGHVCFGCRDNKVHVVSATTGVQSWAYSTGAYVDSSPAACSDGSICVGSANGTIYSFAEDGSVRWQYDTGSSIYSSPAIGPAGAVVIGAANGVIYCFSADSTPPSAPTVADDGLYTSATDRIRGSWSASDPDSGIIAYEFCVGTAPGLADVAGWQNVGVATLSTRIGLSLLDKHVYYITARAINGAGLVGPQASSDGIIVDASLPTTPTVVDDGSYSTDPGTIHARWASSDPESGISKYYYSVSTVPGSTDVLNWTDAGLTTSAYISGLPLNSGQVYYVNVKAINGGGGSSAVGSTDGIAVDFTPPDAPMVIDDGDFISDLHSIHVKWSAEDAESGIAKYEYSVGTTAGETDIKSWTSAGMLLDTTITGLNLTNGRTYYINVRATNGAGLVSDVGSTDGAVLDTTPAATPVVTDDGAWTASMTDLHASWSSSDAESGIKSYRYALGTTSGGTDAIGWTNIGTNTSISLAGLTLTHGTHYYFSVIATNGAGADSAVGTSDGIGVDSTAPVKPTVTDDGASQTSHDTLHAAWTSSDPESGITKYEYCMGSGAGQNDLVDWTDTGTATSVTKTGLTLLEGSRYYISVRATNAVGLISDVGSSDGILIDSTPPPAPTVTDDGAFTSSADTLHVTWAPVTSPSGIASYEYSIGTTAGQTDTKTWTNAALATEATATGLTLQQGKTYYFNVRAISSIGKAGVVGSSDGILVDTTPPGKPTVTDGGAYASSATQLTASWTASDAESGVVSYEYAVGTTSGGTNIKNWTSAGNQTSITIGSLTLVDGGSYYISVRAANGAGLKSQVGTSDGIIVDLSVPSTPTVTDDGVYTTNASQLHATWASSDAQSGIAKYEYAIGTTSGGTDTVAWTSAGTAVEKTITGLSLTSGKRYYISIRSTNGAGMVSAVGTSDGIIVDATPPTTPAVTDDGQYTKSATTIHASWTASDAETGITLYEYSVGTSAKATNVVGWTNIGKTTSVTRSDLTLASGTSYFINVRATNAAGLVSAVGSSDGILVDTTPPQAPTVTDDGEYTSDSSRLHVKVACADPESGIASYEYAVGTMPSGTDIVNWHSDGAGPDITITGLSLTTGVTYYVSARAINGAGITGASAVSDGIKVDNTPPVGITITDDGDFTSSATTLHASWTANDPESGIAKYRFCIGTSPGSNNVASWMDAGTATEYTRTDLTLAHGVTYYISVVAVNGAGGGSSSVSSNGIKVDLTAPNKPVVSDTGVYWGYKTSLWASWTACEDAESGVVDYQVSAGTSPGATDIADWKSVGKVTSYTITGIHLEDGGTYYTNVRAKNGAGGLGAVGSTDGVKIDSTPPTTPIVVDDGDTTSVLDRLHAIWSSDDPESGIAEYTYCIGTSPGGTDVIGWTSAGTHTEVNVTGLALDPVLRYYFSVKACSGAGAWSATGASDGIGYTSGAAIWWRMRGDSNGTGRGLFAATRVSDLAWAVPTGSAIESSPAIAGDGTTYIGSDDGKLYAITQNGTIRWTADLGAPVYGSPCIADDGSIVVGGGDGGVRCLNKSGEVLWSYAAGGMIVASPVVKAGTVYVGSSNGSLYALSLADGAKAWSYGTGGAIWSSPAVDASGIVYVTSEDGCLYAINPSGTRKWRYQTGSSVIASPAVSLDGMIYFGSGDGGFYAIDANGTKKWRFETNRIIDSSAAIGQNGNLYFGTGYEGSDGRVYAVKPDGTELWHVDLPNAGVTSSPAVDPSGAIYFGACDKNIYAYLADGTKLWEYATGDSVAGSPALGADGSVIVGSYDGKVYCLRDATSKDLTPPTTPVVRIPGASIASGDPLRASWSASDPESMVAEYTYAVGTLPGGSDVAGWTSAGIETSVSRDDLPLVAGRTYYVSVKARNPSQRWSEVGISRGVTVMSSVGGSTIGGLKTTEDGSSVSMLGKTVTAVFDDCFFVEENDRSAGIRCVEALTTLSTGQIVDVTGTLATVDGERVVSGATHVVSGAQPAVEEIRPLAMAGSATTSGASPLALEVTLYGRVTSVSDGVFVIDDGSKRASGAGIAVHCVGVPTVSGAPISVDSYVSTTGVLCREGNATVLRLIPGKIVKFK